MVALSEKRELLAAEEELELPLAAVGVFAELALVWDYLLLAAVGLVVEELELMLAAAEEFAVELA
jgi:hypothetical protein